MGEEYTKGTMVDKATFLLPCFVLVLFCFVLFCFD